MPQGTMLSVLHGVRGGDLAHARAGLARPILNTPAQVVRWKEAGGGPCDVMVDTGMNRLGLSPPEAASGLLDGLMVDKIGRASCRDRVCQYVEVSVVAESLKKINKHNNTLTAENNYYVD